ncbi:MAG: hypothetical protein V8Q42_09130 [Anaerovoracaceae bacterium]
MQCSNRPQRTAGFRAGATADFDEEEGHTFTADEYFSFTSDEVFGPVNTVVLSRSDLGDRNILPG